MMALQRFALDWIKKRPLLPPLTGLLRVAIGAESTGFLLYREPPFQVQLVLTNPNSEIVDHRHPRVDSFEVYLSGDMEFRLDGKSVCPPHPSSSLRERLTRVLPTAWHGATIGPRGVVFLSIQEWLCGLSPSSVHLNWEGPALDLVHENEMDNLR